MIIEVIESENELLDGFPEFVEFKTENPATIYYTLDGSDPNEDSLIAVSKVFLPTLAGTLVVKAVAISGNTVSDIITKTYRNDSTNLNGPRNLSKEGITVYQSDGEDFFSLSYTLDGEPAEKSFLAHDDLDIKASLTDSSGVEIGNGKTSRSFINFSKSEPKERAGDTSSPNANYEFDPSAKVIVIDGSSKEAIENQVVKIVNRPYNTFDPTSSFYKERLGQKEPIITGNYVRSFYNPKTKKYISYYWESLESRWIRSEQLLEEKKTLGIGSGSEKRFVYRWVQDRALSQLF